MSFYMLLSSQNVNIGIIQWHMVTRHSGSTTMKLATLFLKELNRETKGWFLNPNWLSEFVLFVLWFSKKFFVNVKDLSKKIFVNIKDIGETAIPSTSKLKGVNTLCWLSWKPILDFIFHFSYWKLTFNILKRVCRQI